MKEFNLLEDRKEGWDFIGKKQGRYITTKKFHYFRNGVSLCGQYEAGDRNEFLPPGAVFRREACSSCWKKLKTQKDNQES